MNIDCILDIFQEATYKLKIEPRRNVAEALGFDIEKVTEHTIFVLHGDPSSTEELPSFVKFSTLIEKGNALMMEKRFALL